MRDPGTNYSLLVLSAAAVLSSSSSCTYAPIRKNDSTTTTTGRVESERPTKPLKGEDVPTKNDER